MNDKFFALWVAVAGTGEVNRHWAGPYKDIDQAKAAVPANSSAMIITVPLGAMTPAEALEAAPILERWGDAA